MKQGYVYIMSKGSELLGRIPKQVRNDWGATTDSETSSE
jgi:hypothetical protein